MCCICIVVLPYTIGRLCVDHRLLFFISLLEQADEKESKKMKIKGCKPVVKE